MTCCGGAKLQPGDERGPSIREFASNLFVLASAEFGGLPTHARGPKWHRLVQGDDLPVLMPSYAVPLLPTTKEDFTNPVYARSAQEWFNGLSDDTAKSIVSMRRAMLHNHQAQALPLGRPARPPRTPPPEVLDALSAAARAAEGYPFHKTGERARLALGLQPVGGVPLASPGALMDRTHGLTLQQQQDMQAQQLMQATALAHAQQQAAFQAAQAAQAAGTKPNLLNNWLLKLKPGAQAQGQQAGVLGLPPVAGVGYAGYPPGALPAGARPVYPLGPGQPLPAPGMPLPPPGMSEVPAPGGAGAGAGGQAGGDGQPLGPGGDVWGAYSGLEPEKPQPWYEAMGAFTTFNYKWNKLDWPEGVDPQKGQQQQQAPGQGAPPSAAVQVPPHLLQAPAGSGAPQPGVMPGTAAPFVPTAPPPPGMPLYNPAAPYGAPGIQQQQPLPQPYMPPGAQPNQQQPGNMYGMQPPQMVGLNQQQQQLGQRPPYIAGMAQPPPQPQLQPGQYNNMVLGQRPPYPPPGQQPPPGAGPYPQAPPSLGGYGQQGPRAMQPPPGSQYSPATGGQQTQPYQQPPYMVQSGPQYGQQQQQQQQPPYGYVTQQGTYPGQQQALPYGAPPPQYPGSYNQYPPGQQYQAQQQYPSYGAAPKYPQPVGGRMDDTAGYGLDQELREPPRSAGGGLRDDARRTSPVSGDPYLPGPPAPPQGRQQQPQQQLGGRDVYPAPPSSRLDQRSTAYGLDSEPAPRSSSPRPNQGLGGHLEPLSQRAQSVVPPAERAGGLRTASPARSTSPAPQSGGGAYGLSSEVSSRPPAASKGGFGLDAEDDDNFGLSQRAAMKAKSAAYESSPSKPGSATPLAGGGGLRSASPVPGSGAGGLKPAAGSGRPVVLPTTLGGLDDDDIDEVPLLPSTRGPAPPAAASPRPGGLKPPSSGFGLDSEVERPAAGGLRSSSPAPAPRPASALKSGLKKPPATKSYGLDADDDDVF